MSIRRHLAALRRLRAVEERRSADYPCEAAREAMFEIDREISRIENSGFVIR